MHTLYLSSQVKDTILEDTKLSANSLVWGSLRLSPIISEMIIMIVAVSVQFRDMAWSHKPAMEWPVHHIQQIVVGWDGADAEGNYEMIIENLGPQLPYLHLSLLHLLLSLPTPLAPPSCHLPTPPAPFHAHLLPLCYRTRYMQVSFQVYQQQIVGTQTECCDGYRMSGSICIRKICIGA